MPGLCREHAHARREGRWVGAVRDYCLFIRGLSFGEFSGCAYLRNDGNPLAIFYTLPHARTKRGSPLRSKRERDEGTFGWRLIYDRAIKVRRGSPSWEEREKKGNKRGRKKFERGGDSNSYHHFFMHSAGLICTEGDLWKDQRRFVAGCLKNFGMTKLPGTRRDKMEERILTAVNECTSVN